VDFAVVSIHNGEPLLCVFGFASEIDRKFSLARRILLCMRCDCSLGAKCDVCNGTMCYDQCGMKCSSTLPCQTAGHCQFCNQAGLCSSPPPQPPEAPKFSAGAVAGIALGCGIGLWLCAVVSVYCVEYVCNSSGGSMRGMSTFLVAVQGACACVVVTVTIGLALGLTSSTCCA
jgi:hypothetical protein